MDPLEYYFIGFCFLLVLFLLWVDCASFLLLLSSVLLGFGWPDLPCVRPFLPLLDFVGIYIMLLTSFWPFLLAWCVLVLFLFCGDVAFVWLVCFCCCFSPSSVFSRLFALFVLPSIFISIAFYSFYLMIHLFSYFTSASFFSFISSLSSFVFLACFLCVVVWFSFVFCFVLGFSVGGPLCDVVCCWFAWLLSSFCVFLFCLLLSSVFSSFVFFSLLDLFSCPVHFFFYIYSF